MGSFARKLARNKLKQEMGNNRIREEFHNRYDSLEQRIKRELKEKDKNLTNKK